MKVLHTSDWHLGKKLYKKDRFKEHECFLEWLHQTIKEQNIEVLLVSGDIFDSPIPPTKSLELYFQFLKKTSEIDHLKKILIISGNHDSGHFLEAPKDFLSDRKIKIVGRYNVPTHENTETKEWLTEYIYDHEMNCGDTVRFGLMPFFKTSDLITYSKLDGESTNEVSLLNTLKAWQEALLSDHSGTSILLAHHLFGQYFSAGSEQTVSLSGLDSIPTEIFKQWDILALGHIHKYQVVSKVSPLAIYPGSPIPMRFSESNNKNVIIYNYNELTKNWDYVKEQIPSARIVKRLTVTQKNYQEKIQTIEQSIFSPFIELTIEMDEVNTKLIDEIREFAIQKEINVLNIIAIYKNEPNTNEDSIDIESLYDMNPVNLFEHYLNEKSVENCDELVQTFKYILDKSNVSEKECH